MRIDDFPPEFRKGKIKYEALAKAAEKGFANIMARRKRRKIETEAPWDDREYILFLSHAVTEALKDLNERLVDVEAYCGKLPAKGRKK